MGKKRKWKLKPTAIVIITTTAVTKLELRIKSNLEIVAAIIIAITEIVGL